MTTSNHLDDMSRVVRYRWTRRSSTGTILEQACLIAVIVKRGNKHLHLVVGAPDGPVKYAMVPHSEERFMTDLSYRNAPYPVKRAAKHLLGRIKRLGGTKKAKVVLQEMTR